MLNFISKDLLDIITKIKNFFDSIGITYYVISNEKRGEQEYMNINISLKLSK